MKTAARAKASRPVEGSTETIAASVPTALVKEIREQVGKGEFSRFVAQALRHELVRLNRAKFIADFESGFGALDKKAVDRARRAIRSA
jgi:Arc/MetJ-type ribon-helix-helix transcriptional regulator